jgi:exopolyphosphatase/guanosine-5'-triphosphate,3'-diphosphate pyrophosphatase
MNRAKLAVIDIGSNSIRLVIYEKGNRLLLPFFNEKIICGLGRNLHHNGNFTIEAKINSIKAVSRFVTIATAIKAEKLIVFATAAFRIAKDGKEFVQQIEKECSIKIEKLSGEQEAKLAAQGVLYSFPKADGIAIDLGGGSIELAYINNNEIGKLYSCNVGLLILQEKMRTEGEEGVKRYIKENLASINIEKYNDTLYLTGGGFRYLAKLHMKFVNYPLAIINNYQISVKNFLEILDILRTKTKEQLEKLVEDYSRSETLKESILLTQSLIEVLRPKNIIFCAYGVREGIALSSSTLQYQNEDALVASCKDILNNDYSASNQTEVLFQWVKQIFRCKIEKFNRLIKACCILSNIARYDHTEYKAELAFQKIIDSIISGITHKERVFIASTLFHRYKIKDKNNIMKHTLKILTPRMKMTAKTLGITLKLAHTFSVGIDSLLKDMKIYIKKNSLVLEISSNSQDLISDTVMKIAKLLAKNLNRKIKIIISFSKSS